MNERILGKFLSEKRLYLHEDMATTRLPNPGRTNSLEIKFEQDGAGAYWASCI